MPVPVRSQSTTETVDQITDDTIVSVIKYAMPVTATSEDGTDVVAVSYKCITHLMHNFRVILLHTIRFAVVVSYI